MSDETAIRVNFGRAMPMFPLNSVTLMPHAVLQLHIFEERYRRMIADALDGPGQIAMAVFAGEGWKDDYLGRPPLRSAVCVGQIMQHQQLPDGRYNVALHGVCRARIVQELPNEEERLYREAVLEPVGIEAIDEEELSPTRERLLSLLTSSSLADLKDAEAVCNHLRDDEVPTSAILELVSFSILGDAELRYRLLAEGDPVKRSKVIEVELFSLRRLLDQAIKQREVDVPKGCSWN